MTKHPIENVLQSMSKRDLEIAEQMREVCGESDESLYAMLDTPNTTKLMQQKMYKNTKPKKD